MTFEYLDTCRLINNGPKGPRLHTIIRKDTSRGFFIELFIFLCYLCWLLQGNDFMLWDPWSHVAGRTKYRPTLTDFLI